MSTDRPSTAAFTSAAHRSTASFELVLGPVLMALIGLALDSWIGTRPLLTVLFCLWGTAGAFVLVFFQYRRDIGAPAAVAGPSQDGAE